MLSLRMSRDTLLHCCTLARRWGWIKYNSTCSRRQSFKSVKIPHWYRPVSIRDASHVATVQSCGLASLPESTPSCVCASSSDPNCSEDLANKAEQKLILEKTRGVRVPAQVHYRYAGVLCDYSVERINAQLALAPWMQGHSWPCLGSRHGELVLVCVEQGNRSATVATKCRCSSGLLFETELQMLGL